MDIKNKDDKESVLEAVKENGKYLYTVSFGEICI